jgi:hypothetical protein
MDLSKTITAKDELQAITYLAGELYAYASNPAYPEAEHVVDALARENVLPMAIKLLKM